MKAKRVALQRKGAAAMIAAEEYARRFESGDVAVCPDTPGNLNGEEQGQSNAKVFCRMCNRVENEGSEKAKKMKLSLNDAVAYLKEVKEVFQEPCHSILDGLLGSHWRNVGLAFNCTFLLFGYVIQLIACARYYNL